MLYLLIYKSNLFEYFDNILSVRDDFQTNLLKVTNYKDYKNALNRYKVKYLGKMNRDVFFNSTERPIDDDHSLTYTEYLSNASPALWNWIQVDEEDPYYIDLYRGNAIRLNIVIKIILMIESMGKKLFSNYNINSFF